jgi:NAD(P)-dependent dehydrogenase (short-subunit alcohol dehydrogenase family)
MSNALDGTGQTALVTGSTDGIGRALAEALAAAGAAVGIVGRNAGSVADVTGAITERTGNAQLRGYVADLSTQADVRRLAAEVDASLPGLDVLVHCAGVYLARRTITSDGLEMMFATNLLAPFLLTTLLHDRLVANAPARVLLISAPSTTKLDLDDLQGERGFRPLTAFGASKAGELLLSFELARRWDGSGVTVNAVHPGLARTNLMRQAPAPIRWLSRLASAPPQRAAAAIVPLALSAEYANRTGRFFAKGREIDPPPYTRDPEVARRLWDACAGLTGLSD